jgi:NADH-quinone oxidoreductase subunit F
MLEILERITEGQGKMEDIDELEQLCISIKDGSLCGLGQTAPNPVLTTLRYFKDEYIAHIRDGKCPAKQCKKLITYSILKDKCIGCGLCARKCPTEAITGEKKKPHEIDAAKCIKCGNCASVCKFGSINIE